MTDGKAIPINWEKDGEFGPTRYFDANHDEVVLNQGKTMGLHHSHQGLCQVGNLSEMRIHSNKHESKDKQEKKQETEIIKYFKHPKRRKLKFSRKQLLCLLLCAATLLGFFCYRQLNTFSALYSRAKKQYAQQNYEEAQRIAENALDKNPKNEAANLLLAKVWRNQAINDLHFLFCARLSRTKLREQEYIKSM